MNFVTSAATSGSAPSADDIEQAAFNAAANAFFANSSAGRALATALEGGVAGSAAVAALLAGPIGDGASSTKILNATTAASSPSATPADTALADSLALAHKIQVHAQYVQKWFGPAEAAKYFNARYLTTANLGA
jgi:hypothetical protein